MLKIWAGLEARSFLQASIESVSLLILQEPQWGLFLICSARTDRVGIGGSMRQIRSFIAQCLVAQQLNVEQGVQ